MHSCVSTRIVFVSSASVFSIIKFLLIFNMLFTEEAHQLVTGFLYTYPPQWHSTAKANVFLRLSNSTRNCGHVDSCAVKSRHAIKCFCDEWWSEWSSLTSPPLVWAELRKQILHECHRKTYFQTPEMNEIGPTMQSSKKTWTQSQLEHGESEDWNLTVVCTSVHFGTYRQNSETN